VRLDGDAALAIRAWNLMGGIDWAGLPVVAEMLGFDDPEILITQLAQIRDAQRNKD
jgi:hypothetical protein